jgi:hypothetical protein
MIQITAHKDLAYRNERIDEAEFAIRFLALWFRDFKELPWLYDICHSCAGEGPGSLTRGPPTLHVVYLDPNGSGNVDPEENGHIYCVPCLKDLVGGSQTFRRPSASEIHGLGNWLEDTVVLECYVPLSPRRERPRRQRRESTPQKIPKRA